MGKDTDRQTAKPGFSDIYLKHVLKSGLKRLQMAAKRASLGFIFSPQVMSKKRGRASLVFLPHCSEDTATLAQEDKPPPHPAARAGERRGLADL